MTSDALSLISVDADLRSSLWRAIAAVLHLGQLAFDHDSTSGVEDPGSLVSSTAELSACAEILGVGPEALSAACTVRTMRTVGEELKLPLPVADAIGTRDALAKELYSRLFDWLVARINASTVHKAVGGALSTIGLLDIFGFESFVVNRFEQLCTSPSPSPVFCMPLSADAWLCST